MVTGSRSDCGTPIADADPLCRLSAAQLVAGYGTGELSPVEVAHAALDRAEVVRRRFGAFVSLDRQGALAAAKASECRWRDGAANSPIDGVPTTIKDVVWVKGWTVRYGSATTPASTCSEDSPAVERLREAGAVLIGLTTTPEFGWKAVTDNRVDGVTRNPWNPGLTSGGSSGGAAVAAATAAGTLHLGTDGGGSIRIPAAFCGIVGHKPTYGRVAAHPASAFGTLAHIGPMARCVDDAARMLAAMSGRDTRDWTQGPGVLPALAQTTCSLSGLRVGFWSKPAEGGVDPQVCTIVDAAVQHLSKAGAEVRAVTMPEADLPTIFRRLWFAAAAQRVARLDEVERRKIDPGLAEIAAAGVRLSAADYVSAQMARAKFGAAMDLLLEKFDMVVSPAVAILPFAVACEVAPGSGLTRWSDWAGFNYPLNLSQQPACVIPCGMSGDGRPVGLQLIGARGTDGLLLARAQLCELMFAVDEAAHCAAS